MELQCRSTMTWTGCVAATAVKGGHVLPTSTLQTPASSIQVHGPYKQVVQNQGGYVEGTAVVVAASQ